MTRLSSETARRVRALVAEMERGCGVAGPRAGNDQPDPFACEECCAVFVRAVRGVVAARVDGEPRREDWNAPFLSPDFTRHREALLADALCAREASQ